MTVRGVLLCFVLWLAGTTHSAAAEEPLLLRFQPKPGEPEYLEFRQVVETHGQGPATSVGRQLMGMIQQVENSEDAKLTKVRLTWERIALKAEGGPQLLDFDIDKPDVSQGEQMIGQFFRPLMGQWVFLEVDAAGQAAKLRGMLRVRQAVQQAMQNPGLFNQMGTVLDEDTNKLMWGTARLAIYANKPVKVGDTWTNTTQQRGRSAMLQFEYRCKLARIEEAEGRKMAVVTYDGSVTSDASTNAPQAMRISGRFTGEGRYDAQRGQMVSQVQDIDMEATRVEPNASQPAKPENTQHIRQEYHLLPLPHRTAEKARAAAATQASTSRPASIPATQPTK